jgi:hypothetical protein
MEMRRAIPGSRRSTAIHGGRKRTKIAKSFQEPQDADTKKLTRGLQVKNEKHNHRVGSIVLAQRAILDTPVTMIGFVIFNP